MSDWPDVEGAVRGYLREDADLVRLLDGARVFFGVPDSPTFPLVTVSRVGGGEHPTSDAPLDLALISIDVFGELDDKGRPRKIQATQVVNTVRSALERIRSRTTAIEGVDIFVASVESVIYAPDPDNGRPHYVVTTGVAAISS